MKHTDRGFNRSPYNAEEEFNRGSVFDRSRRQRGSYDLPQQYNEEERFGMEFDPGFYETWDDEGIGYPYSGYQRAQAWWQAPGPFVGMGPRGYQRSDERIMEEVCDRLMWHGQLNAEDIEVEVRDREVILNGEVEDRRSKHLVEEAVSSITGVEDVRNRLRVRSRTKHAQTGRHLPGISMTQMSQGRFQGEATGPLVQSATEDLSSLEGLFFEELKDIYDGEKQILDALPRMERSAHSTDLKRGFKEHRDQTQRQVERLEQIFQEHGRRAERKHCAGVMGILQEGEQLMHEKEVHHHVMDAGLIASAQKVEHYEIATYGTLRTYARQLGFDKAARLLDDILNEESKTNERLTSMAVGHINQKARS
jgi:ferritin-like metal-binding protein YciE